MNNDKLNTNNNISTVNPDAWLVLLNPHAGCGKGLQDKGVVEKKLQDYSFSYKLVLSEYPGQAIFITRRYIREGYRKFLVAGGDGTLNEVVNGIYLFTTEISDDIVLGMIPVGTGNDWIKTFGIPDDYDRALKIILEGKTVRQDIGKISYNLGKKKKRRFFANIAGFGFDAMVAEKANQLKEMGMKGFRVYLQSLLSSYFNYRTTKMKVSIDNQEIEDLIFTLSIGIGKFNGGGMMQTPFAVPNNGAFQLTVIRKIGLLGILRNIIRLYSGDFVKDRRVSTYECKEVLVTGDNTIMGEVDGESLGNSSFEISMIQEKLNVIYGNDKYLNKENLAENLKETIQE